MGKASHTIDMTRGPIAGPLVVFILPLIGSSIFQQLYNTVDFLFVGNFMDKTAAAAVGASATLITCTIGLFTGISVGASVIVSHAIGAGEYRRASRGMHTSVLLGILGGTAMTILGLLLAPVFLRLLNTPETALPQAILYIRIYLLSVPMLVFYNMVSGCMRAEGDSRSPFLVLACCGILNVALDALFIAALGMGVAGSAVATVLAQAASALLIGILARQRRRRIRLTLHGLHLDIRLLGNILRIGLPAGIQTIIITFSNIIVQYFINAFGETAVAAFATYYNVECLNFLVIVAFGQAATTFAGQNIGACQYRRIRKGILIIVLFGAGVVFCISNAILLWSDAVFGCFMKDEAVRVLAIRLAMVSFPFYFIYPVLEVFGGAIRAMGHSLLSMVIVIANLCLLRISLLKLFSETVHTLQSLAAVYPITWATAALSFITAFFILMQKQEKTAEDPNGWYN